MCFFFLNLNICDGYSRTVSFVAGKSTYIQDSRQINEC